MGLGTGPGRGQDWGQGGDGTGDRARVRGQCFLAVCVLTIIVLLSLDVSLAMPALWGLPSLCPPGLCQSWPWGSSLDPGFRLLPLLAAPSGACLSSHLGFVTIFEHVVQFGHLYGVL